MKKPTRAALSLSSFVLGLATVLCFTSSRAAAYTTTSTVLTPPDYTTFRPPVKGGSYLDPVFGTAIKRVSDAMNTRSAATGNPVIAVTQEYSTMSPFNMDNTRLLLVHMGYFSVYDESGNLLDELYQYGISSSTQPRWSRTDPNVFYFVTGNALKKFNVGTKAATNVHTFSEYSKISGMGESDICFDGNHFVIAGDNRYVFVYEIPADAKGPVFDAGAPGLFDNLYITPDDNVIIGWYANGSNRQQGVELYNRNLVFQRQLTHAMGHMDVTRDLDGSEVMLWANGADPQLQVRCDAGITKVRLSDARQTCLFAGDWSLAHHVSAADNSGWFVMETYNPIDIMPPTGWVSFTNEIVLVKMDGSEVRRVLHHRSRPLNSYQYQPKASISRDGTKMVFTSNYGLQAQLSYPTEYSDTYLVDLSQLTATPVPDPPTGGTTRVEESNAAVSYTGSWHPSVNGVHSGGGATGSMDVNSKATLRFTGTDVSLLLYTDQWSGIASVAVDGVVQGEVDTYASPAKAQSAIYKVSGLSNGEHTVSIGPTGRKSASSGGLWIWVDAFDVSVVTPEPDPEPPSASYRVQQTSPAVALSGNWSVNTSAKNSGGSAGISMASGARATFSFKGTSVSWIGYKDMSSGIARVYVDGALAATVDMYSLQFKAQATAYTVSGLAYGAHTIVVEATGTKRTLARGTWICVDAFDYDGAPLSVPLQ